MIYKIRMKDKKGFHVMDKAFNTCREAAASMKAIELNGDLEGGFEAYWSKHLKRSIVILTPTDCVTFDVIKFKK